jgi:hypothetical protein
MFAAEPSSGKRIGPHHIVVTRAFSIGKRKKYFHWINNIKQIS